MAGGGRSYFDIGLWPNQPCVAPRFGNPIPRKASNTLDEQLSREDRLCMNSWIREKIMERETWKNLGLVGTAVVAFGCGGVWLYGGSQEEIPAAMPRKTPVKVVEAEEVKSIKPKPKPIEADSERPRVTRVTLPVDTGDRKTSRPKPGSVKRRGGPVPAA